MIPIRDNIPSRAFPIVNTGIIAACVVMFIYQLSDPAHKLRIAELAFRPVYLFSLFSPSAWLEFGPVHIATKLVASIFMHGGLAHIGGNMLFLWVFGDNVEDRMGHLRYLLFYLVCGLAATLAHTLLGAVSSVVGGAAGLDVPMVGASGAIAGVLGAYFLLYAGAYIRSMVIFFFITFVDIPAGAFIGFWFIYQLFMMVLTPSGGGGVAYAAHVGGFIAGYWICKLYFGRRPRRKPGPRVLDIRFD